MSDLRRRAFYEADSLTTEIYDALAASIIPGSSVEGDIDFYLRLAEETGGPILDVGCGTGRVATALVADGHEVVGVDLSAPMLRLAEQRREALSADVAARLSFHQADMTTLALGREAGNQPDEPRTWTCTERPVILRVPALERRSDAVRFNSHEYQPDLLAQSRRCHPPMVGNRCRRTAVGKSRH